MQSSKTIAGLVGPSMLLIAAVVLVNIKLFPRLVDEILLNPLLVILAGIITFVAGLAIVRAHNRWEKGWPVIITLIGWLCIIGGLVRSLFPVLLAQMAVRIIRIPGILLVAAIIMLLLGAFLSFKAYRRTS
jgi:cytochrome bd-type quinol oxidase subunit 2